MVLLLSTLIGTLLVLLVLLAIPVDLYFMAVLEEDAPLEKELRLSWGFGLVRLTLLGRPSRRRSDEPTPAPPHETAAERAEARRRRAPRRMRWHRLVTNPVTWQLRVIVKSGGWRSGRAPF